METYIKDLKERIETARKNLYYVWEQKNIMTDPEVVKTSEEFDHLINEYRTLAKDGLI